MSGAGPLRLEPCPGWSGLAGATVVVTGAVGGLGRAMCHAAADEGARVIAVDRDEVGLDALVGELRADAVPVAGDVTTEECHREVQTHAADGAALWVNNAGIVRRGPADKLEAADWQAVYEVNVKATLLGSQAAYRLMAPHGGGSIVNVGSVTGTKVMQGRAAYGSSKAALNSLTRYLASEWGPAGIRVNTVAPGFVLTAISHLSGAPAEEVEQTLATIPLRRLGTPKDVAGVVLSLASPHLSYVTGQVLHVDGGWTL